MKKVVVFATNHEVTPAQRAYFEQKGIDVISFKELVDSGEADRSLVSFTSGADAWTKVKSVTPDGAELVAVVGVLPIQMIGQYLNAAEGTPLLRADMVCTQREDRANGIPATYEWQGTFTRTLRVIIDTEPFAL